MAEWSTLAAAAGAGLGGALRAVRAAAFFAIGFLATTFFETGFFAAGFLAGIGMVIPPWPECWAKAGVALTSEIALVAPSNILITIFSIAATR